MKGLVAWLEEAAFSEKRLVFQRMLNPGSNVSTAHAP